MRLKPNFYSVALALTGLVALAPVAFNFVVDAYDYNKLFGLDLDKKEISVKAHYPLYKMIEYPRVKAPVVILGDSRARALQDKYWQELGRNDVYNFAYGGATVFEIYDTFKYLQSTADIDTLIISLPLRSMDARFKGGMNRVPEAIKLANNPFEYYSNWFVAKTGWSLLVDRYPELATPVQTSGFWPIAPAEAAEFSDVKPFSLEALLDPGLCDDCTLKTPNETLILPAVYHGRGLGLGLGTWARFWPDITSDRDLPQLFAKQVGTNGAADWRRFKQSNELWAMVEEIAVWSETNDVDLLFLIPPTISEMQRRISDFGLVAANHKFRERLSTLAPVVDLDYDSPFSRDLANFTDAYHFGSASARLIVGELLQLLDSDPKLQTEARARRGPLACPVRVEDTTNAHAANELELLEGQSCRIWRQTNDKT